MLNYHKEKVYTQLLNTFNYDFTIHDYIELDDKILVVITCNNSREIVFVCYQYNCIPFVISKEQFNSILEEKVESVKNIIDFYKEQENPMKVKEIFESFLDELI